MRARLLLPLRRPAVILTSAGFVLAGRATLRAEDRGSAATDRPPDGGAPHDAPRSKEGGVPAADGGRPSAAPVSAIEDGGGDGAGAADRDSSVATMQCAHVAAAPARVLCAVEAHVGEGESIGWGDAVLVTMPPFVEALRGRLGPADAAERDATKWRWELGLVARGNGAGAIGGRVRLVVCIKDACAPRIVPFQGHIAVGE